MRRTSRGMTLIEVLVAFVVLSLTMAVIFQIFAGGMRNARLSNGYSRAVFLAESKLAAAGVERPLVMGGTSGQAGPHIQWRVDITPVDDGNSTEQQLMFMRLYQVRAWVGWAEDGHERHIELETLKLGPRQ